MLNKCRTNGCTVWWLCEDVTDVTVLRYSVEPDKGQGPGDGGQAIEVGLGVYGWVGR